MNQREAYYIDRRIKAGVKVGPVKRAGAALQGTLGSISRFAKDYQIEPNDRITKLGIASRTVPTEVVVEACRLKDKGFSIKRIAAHLNVPVGTVHSWVYRRRLPKTGRYTIERYRLVLTKARDMYRSGMGSPRQCFRRAAIEAGMKWKSCRVHLCMESVPAIAGLPIYADPAVQLRAEQVGLYKLAGASPIASCLEPNPRVLGHQRSHHESVACRQAKRSNTRP